MKPRLIFRLGEWWCGCWLHRGTGPTPLEAFSNWKLAKALWDLKRAVLEDRAKPLPRMDYPFPPHYDTLRVPQSTGWPPGTVLCRSH